jgi:hypothetical protein
MTHQSALAGIQLAASFIRQLHGSVIDTTEITRASTSYAHSAQTFVSPLGRATNADLPGRRLRAAVEKWGNDQVKGSVGPLQSGLSNGA